MFLIGTELFSKADKRWRHDAWQTKGEVMSGDAPPPNSGVPQPPHKPLHSIVEEVAAPWAEAITDVGQDIIRKNQEPPPQAMG